MKQGVINIAIEKALRKEPLQIWGDGEGKKDYIYVEDFVEILFKLLAKGVHSEVLNVASGQLLSVNKIAETTRKLVPNFVANHSAAQQSDASHFELNTDKLLNLIGDYQFTPFEDGLQKTYYWTLSKCN